MKVKFIKISNVLSFRFYENLSEAAVIYFNDILSILIGQNGSGKSTALEVINFIFKRVLFAPVTFKYDVYNRRLTAVVSEKKDILNINDNTRYKEFRLEPNWDTVDKPQKIIIKLELDEIDLINIQNLENNKEKISRIASIYSRTQISNFNMPERETLLLKYF